MRHEKYLQSIINSDSGLQLLYPYFSSAAKTYGTLNAEYIRKLYGMFIQKSGAPTFKHELYVRSLDVQTDR